METTISLFWRHSFQFKGLLKALLAWSLCQPAHCLAVQISEGLFGRLRMAWTEYWHTGQIQIKSTKGFVFLGIKFIRRLSSKLITVDLFLLLLFTLYAEESIFSNM